MCRIFLGLSHAKFKEGLIVGPDIRELMKDEKSDNLLGETGNSAWSSFKNVFKNLLGNHKSPDYKDNVGRMLEKFKALECKINLKVCFLHAQLEPFPENVSRRERRAGGKVPPGHEDGKNVSKTVEC